MTTEAEPTLAGEFPPATEEQWLALVDKVLKGAPLSKLRSLTPGGLVVEPLYTRDGSPGAPTRPAVPGAAPFVRGSSAEPHPGGGWGIRTLLTNPDPPDANRTALRELERGATELTVRFDAAFRSARAADRPGVRRAGGASTACSSPRPTTWRRCSTACYLDLAPVHLQPGAQFSRAAELLLAVWDRQGVDRRPRPPAASAPTRWASSPRAAGLPQGIDGALAETGRRWPQRLSGSHPQVADRARRHHALRRGRCERDRRSWR